MLMRIMPRLATELEALGKQAALLQAAAKHSVCRQAPGLQRGRVSAAGLPPRIQQSALVAAWGAGSAAAISFRRLGPPGGCA